MIFYFYLRDNILMCIIEVCEFRDYIEDFN